MPLYRVCNRHRRSFPYRSSCPQCRSEKAEREKPRRAANNARLGRKTTHWIGLSARLRRAAGGVCPCCGRDENPDDARSKLTVDLVRGGDHSTATADECEVKCRACHGLGCVGGRCRRRMRT